MGRMCGRYASIKAPADLADEFRRRRRRPDGRRRGPDYNVAPTKQVVAVVERHPRDADGTPDPDRDRAHPADAALGPGAVLGQGPKGGARMINARAEIGGREAGVPHAR